MNKKKLTKKEIDIALDGLSNNDMILRKENLEMKQYFALYLEYRQEVFKEDIEDYNKFVKGKVEEFEKQQRSENKEGA